MRSFGVMKEKCKGVSQKFQGVNPPCTSLRALRSHLAAREVETVRRCVPRNDVLPAPNFTLQTLHSNLDTRPARTIIGLLAGRVFRRKWQKIGCRTTEAFGKIRRRREFGGRAVSRRGVVTEKR